MKRRYLIKARDIVIDNMRKKKEEAMINEIEEERKKYTMIQK